MEQQNVCAYLKEQGCVTAKLMSGPNGNWILGLRADGTKMSLPVGKKSQTAKLDELTVLMTDDGAAIATANKYEQLEEATL